MPPVMRWYVADCSSSSLMIGTFASRKISMDVRKLRSVVSSAGEE